MRTDEFIRICKIYANHCVFNIDYHTFIHCVCSRQVSLDLKSIYQEYIKVALVLNDKYMPNADLKNDDFIHNSDLHSHSNSSKSSRRWHSGVNDTINEGRLHVFVRNLMRLRKQVFPQNMAQSHPNTNDNGITNYSAFVFMFHKYAESHLLNFDNIIKHLRSLYNAGKLQLDANNNDCEMLIHEMAVNYYRRKMKRFAVCATLALTDDTRIIIDEWLFTVLKACSVPYYVSYFPDIVECLFVSNFALFFCISCHNSSHIQTVSRFCVFCFGCFHMCCIYCLLGISCV